MLFELISGYLTFQGLHIQRNKLNDFFINLSPNSRKNISDYIDILMLFFFRLLAYKMTFAMCNLIII